MEMEEGLKKATSEKSNIKINLDALKHTCRICLTSCRTNGELKCVLSKKQLDEDVIEKIQFCTGIKLQQFVGLKFSICSLCRHNLSIAYEFKTCCLTADEKFHKLLEKASDGHFESDDEYVDIVAVKEEKYEHFVEDVKTEDLEEDSLQNDEDIEEKAEELESPPPKTKVITRGRGRPKKSSTTTKKPRRLKKYKFTKLCCEPCNLKFETKAQSNEHKKEMHKDSETWVCEVCGKMFLHRASHYTHVKSHQPPKYGCDQCDYKTWHKHDLVKHIRIHTGLKLYQCEYCTCSFYTSSNLISHIRRHHMLERPHHCHLCRRRFFDKTKLNRHLDSHLEIKRFECSVCHACFTRRCYWKKHLLRQHDIDVPPQRPGRQKMNLVIGDYLVNKQEAFGELFNKDIGDQKV